MAQLTKVALLALLVAGAGAAGNAEAANIYKYTDARGRTVFNSSIPPELVKNGYTILNERGQVVEVVPRALTPAEIAARDAAEQQRLAAEEAERRQREADNLLLRTFASVDEIVGLRDVRVQRLDTRLAELNDSLAKAVDDTERQSLQNEITVVEAEKQEEIDTAARNVARYRELTGAAEQPAGQ